MVWSPYAYGKNNPVRYIDLDGMADKDTNGGGSESDMDQDLFGRDKFDGWGQYVPSFERGAIDWGRLSQAFQGPAPKQVGKQGGGYPFAHYKLIILMIIILLHRSIN